MTTPDTRAWYADPGVRAERPRPSQVRSPVWQTTAPPGSASTSDAVLVRGQIRQRFTAGEGRFYLHLGLTGLFLLLAALFALTGAGVYWVGPSLVVAGFQGLAAGVMPRFGVVLTTSGVTLRGWRTRHHPWSDVQRIEPANFLWARSAGVRLTNGSTVRTWAPYDDFLLADLKFDHKVEAMQQWHAAHMVPTASPNGERPAVAGADHGSSVRPRNDDWT